MVFSICCAVIITQYVEQHWYSCSLSALPSLRKPIGQSHGGVRWWWVSPPVWWVTSPLGTFIDERIPFFFPSMMKKTVLKEHVKCPSVLSVWTATCPCLNVPLVVVFHLGVSLSPGGSPTLLWVMDLSGEGLAPQPGVKYTEQIVQELQGLDCKSEHNGCIVNHPEFIEVSTSPS